MKEWERHACDALRSLGEAYQQGGVSRDTYRWRRRRMLDALRGSDDITARQPMPGTGRRAGDPATSPEALTLLLGTRRLGIVTWLLVAALGVLCGAAVVMWTSG